MEIIKFKVFNKNTGKIIKQNDCEIRFLNGSSYKVYVNDEEVCNNKTSKLLQYIGINDVNNKEIYNGDIVVKFNGREKTEVMWVENRHTTNSWTINTQNCIIIGNKYENPDLLNDVYRKGK